MFFHLVFMWYQNQFPFIYVTCCFKNPVMVRLFSEKARAVQTPSGPSRSNLGELAPVQCKLKPGKSWGSSGKETRGGSLGLGWPGQEFWVSYDTMTPLEGLEQEGDVTVFLSYPGHNWVDIKVQEKAVSWCFLCFLFSRSPEPSHLHGLPASLSNLPRSSVPAQVSWFSGHRPRARQGH